MCLSYDRLWEMLLKLNISKMEFAKTIGISNATLAKLGKNEPVALTVLMRICEHYNCKIENIMECISDNKENFPNISTMDIGTILVCTCYPLGTPVRSRHIQRRSNVLKKQPCVILQTLFRDNYTPQLLVAPLSYDIIPDTIFDVPFKNVEIGENIIEHGYILVGKMGYVIQKECENILGKMPIQYINESITVYESLKPILGTKDTRLSC